MSAARRSANKETLSRLHEAVNSGDAELILKTIGEVFEPGVLIRTPLPVEATGVQALKEVFGRLLQAFPDLHIAAEDMIAEGNMVVCRNTVTGTHQGEYMGLPPTGRSVSYDEIFIFRFAGDRVAETWGVVDILAQMRQLGVAPGTSS
ncbi:ester cyclase [Streptomyces sp. NBC_00344]|uniref:ester cyclase n=1 Tax=Streptomyces sp. NBC_00344 TaxID=2975720 RepID=UPI002E244EC4